MSVSENVGSPLTLIAAEAIRINTFVFINTDGEAAETNAGSDRVVGVALETVAIGESVPVCTNQGARLEVIANGAHSAGDPISAGAAGEAIAEGAAGLMGAGIVLVDVAADQELAQIILQITRIHA